MRHSAEKEESSELNISLLSLSLCVYMYCMHILLLDVWADFHGCQLGPDTGARSLFLRVLGHTLLQLLCIYSLLFVILYSTMDRRGRGQINNTPLSSLSFAPGERVFVLFQPPSHLIAPDPFITRRNVLPHSED